MRTAAGTVSVAWSCADAVAAAAPHWSPDQRDTAAGVLDVLWHPAALERLTAQWRMTPQQATGAIAWAIGLVALAVHDGTAPQVAPGTT